MGGRARGRRPAVRRRDFCCGDAAPRWALRRSCACDCAWRAKHIPVTTIRDLCRHRNSWRALGTAGSSSRSVRWTARGSPIAQAHDSRRSGLRDAKNGRAVARARSDATSPTLGRLRDCSRPGCPGRPVGPAPHLDSGASHHHLPQRPSAVRRGLTARRPAVVPLRRPGSGSLGREAMAPTGMSGLPCPWLIIPGRLPCLRVDFGCRAVLREEYFPICPDCGFFSERFLSRPSRDPESRPREPCRALPNRFFAGPGRRAWETRATFRLRLPRPLGGPSASCHPQPARPHAGPPHPGPAVIRDERRAPTLLLPASRFRPGGAPTHAATQQRRRCRCTLVALSPRERPGKAAANFEPSPGAGSCVARVARLSPAPGWLQRPRRGWGRDRWRAWWRG